jgi:hypothetical protein
MRGVRGLPSFLANSHIGSIERVCTVLKAYQGITDTPNYSQNRVSSHILICFLLDVSIGVGVRADDAPDLLTASRADITAPIQK